jgi:hypothetical protein
VVDPIEKIGHVITKYTKCGYGLHFFHNLCIFRGNIINMEWAQTYEQTMQMEANYLLGQFQHKTMFHVTEQTIKETCQQQLLEGITQI